MTLGVGHVELNDLGCWADILGTTVLHMCAGLHAAYSCSAFW